MQSAAALVVWFTSRHANCGGFLDINLTRRLFLTQAGASLGLLYIGSLTPELLAQAHDHAKAVAAAGPNSALRFFTSEEAADFDAFSAQIIPTDDTPGAREANVVHCVDYLLTAFDADRQTDMKKALKALNEQAAKTVPGATSFAKLSSAQQIEVMKAMEKTHEFGILREYTLVAFFGDPALGGNTNEVGWKLLEFDSAFFFRPPFGYYDAQPNEEKA
jgi:gluconate 2-dehydrogenase gamma chain